MSMFYKYRSISFRSLRMVTNGELYFSPPDKLNDPLDCSFFPSAILGALEAIDDADLRNAITELIERDLTGRVMGNTGRILEAIENRLKKVGILSLSTNSRDPLMWSHYGDEHKGICVGFDEDALKTWVDESASENLLIGDVGVSYRDAPDLVEVLKRYAKRHLDGHEIITDHLFGDLLMPALRSKSTHWKYESEVRLIRHESGLLCISPDIVREVVFGKRVSDADKDSILQILDRASLSHIRVGHADYKSNSFEMSVNWV